MSAWPKKIRSTHKKSRTMSQITSQSHSPRKIRSYQRSKMKNEEQVVQVEAADSRTKQFYLQEDITTQFAKHQLNQLSQNHLESKINKDIWSSKQTEQWLHSDYNLPNRQAYPPYLDKHKGQNKSYQNLNNKIYPRSLYSYSSHHKKDRSKTEASYNSKSISLNKCSDDKQCEELNQEVANLIKQEGLRKERRKKSSFNQVINFSPEIIQFQALNTDVENINQTKEFIRSKINNNRQTITSKKDLQIPKNTMGGKKVKGLFFVKNQMQRNFYYRKTNNTMVIQKKYSQQQKYNIIKTKRDLYEQKEDQKQKQGNVPNNQVSREVPSFQSTNLQYLMRKSILNLEQTRKIKQNRQQNKNQKHSQLVSKTSPIHSQLQKLKRLISGQQMNYAQINANCPIKIFGLKSFSKLSQG